MGASWESFPGGPGDKGAVRKAAWGPERTWSPQSLGSKPQAPERTKRCSVHQQIFIEHLLCSRLLAKHRNHLEDSQVWTQSDICAAGSWRGGSSGEKPGTKLAHAGVCQPWGVVRVAAPAQRVAGAHARGSKQAFLSLAH